MGIVDSLPCAAHSAASRGLASGCVHDLRRASETSASLLGSERAAVCTIGPGSDECRRAPGENASERAPRFAQSVSRRPASFDVRRTIHRQGTLIAPAAARHWQLVDRAAWIIAIPVSNIGTTECGAAARLLSRTDANHSTDATGHTQTLRSSPRRFQHGDNVRRARAASRTISTSTPPVLNLKIHDKNLAVQGTVCAQSGQLSCRNPLTVAG